VAVKRSCLDEIILGGDIQETSKREVLRVCAAQDEQVRVALARHPARS